MQFRAEIQLSGKTATGIHVPDDVISALGISKRPPVRVTINDYTYRNTVARMGGEFMLSVSAEVRERAGVAAGDEVDVGIELDTELREVEVLGDFAEALKNDEEAQRFFDGLSYGKKRWFVLSIEGAKAAATRERRIAKSVSMLHEVRIGN